MYTVAGERERSQEKQHGNQHRVEENLTEQAETWLREQFAKGPLGVRSGHLFERDNTDTACCSRKELSIFANWKVTSKIPIFSTKFITINYPKGVGLQASEDEAWMLNFQVMKYTGETCSLIKTSFSFRN